MTITADSTAVALTKGATGVAGATGVQGIQGAVGPQGPAGTNGTNGTSAPVPVMISAYGVFKVLSMTRGGSSTGTGEITLVDNNGYTSLYNNEGFLLEEAQIRFVSSDCTGQGYIVPSTGWAMYPMHRVFGGGGGLPSNNESLLWTTTGYYQGGTSLSFGSYRNTGGAFALNTNTGNCVTAVSGLYLNNAYAPSTNGRIYTVSPYIGTLPGVNAGAILSWQ